MQGGFDFGWALWKLRWALKVKRSGWPKDRWIALYRRTDEFKIADYIYYKNARGDNVLWSPQQEDLIAEDWMLAE